MKRFPFIAVLLVMLLNSCVKFDDSELRADIQDLQKQIEALQKHCDALNSDIAKVQQLVTALGENTYVTDISMVMEGGEQVGYTLHFNNRPDVTITNGRDGAAGYTPSIGVRRDSDGNYYWTLDGDWLYDGNRNRIRANGLDGADGQDGENGSDGQDGLNGNNGRDGTDGITPRLRIENGYWQVSYDNGVSWTNLGKATGEASESGDGGSIFASCTYDDSSVTVTLHDGTVLVLPRQLPLSITFSSTEVSLGSGESAVITYSVTGAASTVVKTLGQDGWKIRLVSENAASGSLRITAPDDPQDSEVIVLVSDGGSRTIMAGIRCIAQVPAIVSQENYGFYGVFSADISYDRGSTQLSLFRKDSGLSFMLIDPSSVQVTYVSGIVENAASGASMSLVCTIEKNGQKTSQKTVEAKVVKVAGGKMWLSTSEGGIVIMK